MSVVLHCRGNIEIHAAQVELEAGDTPRSFVCTARRYEGVRVYHRSRRAPDEADPGLLRLSDGSTRDTVMNIMGSATAADPTFFSYVEIRQVKKIMRGSRVLWEAPPNIGVLLRSITTRAALAIAIREAFVGTTEVIPGRDDT